MSSSAGYMPKSAVDAIPERDAAKRALTEALRAAETRLAYLRGYRLEEKQHAFEVSSRDLTEHYREIQTLAHDADRLRKVLATL